MFQKGFAVAGAAVLALALSTSARAGVIYNFTSFDGPGNNGGGTTVNGINNNGAVVGFSSDNALNPTLFTNFIRNPDGTFTLLAIGGDPLAMANGINNSLAVVGGASNGTAFFLPNGGSPSTLPGVNPTTVSETAFGINDANIVVGQYTDSATGTTPGYLFNGSFTTLVPAINAVDTNAQGINDLGMVTGFYSIDGAHQHGFFYNSVTQQFTLPSDPNVANLFLTQFLGINDNGLAEGYYQTNDGSQHGFLYDIATQTYTFLDDPFAATSGVSITQITGVNDSGEIAGFYVDAATGRQRGFIASAVPEPSAISLVLVGLLMLLSRRIRAALTQ
jgi:hypothetical protein